MRRDNTPWHPVASASLDWSEQGSPLSRAFGDIYYSRDNGLEESRYVFLQGNDLPTRWLEAPGRYFCIAETGFGTGLNFLLTWQSWHALPEPRPALHYLAIEKHPLSSANMARALAAWSELEPLASQLLEQYPGLVPGQHRLLLAGGRITLDLWWEDIADALPDLASRGVPCVDAWYLDGFAPARNPQMWQPDILRAAASLSRPGASFATFTAAGQVRRGLSAAGFQVEKTPGYGRKRECLRGALATSPAMSPATATPWDLVEGARALPGTAIVLGAGLAGCTTAAALARRGVHVTVLDRAGLAGAGSANDQGILYTRLSRRHSSLTDFALQSFRFSSAYYAALFSSGQLAQGLDGDLCGSFHQNPDAAELAALSDSLTTVPELARVLGAEEARDFVGLEQPHGGYWYPNSGWLRPASVCRALLDHANIELLENCGEISIGASSSGWLARATGAATIEAPCLIVATGTDTGKLPGFEWLPLQAIRGQTTHLPASADFAGLRAVLCHEGYIAPPRERVHCIGATFGLQDADPTLRLEDHRSNLARLGSAVPAWRSALEVLDPAALAGRVGYRCASQDYLPLVGPVPDMAGFLRQFAQLRKNARQIIQSKGEFMPGLYLSTAHGSRGLTSAPLAAELLASEICAEPAPMSRELSRALAPARFIIRDLCRNRI